MTDTNTPTTDDGNAEEREAIEELRSMGISIVSEDGEHTIGYGGLVRYLVVGRRGTEESDPTLEAIGDGRLAALRALKLQALAS